MPNTQLSDTYLKRQQLEAKFGVSRATIYRWTKAGTFPAAIHLGANMVRWKSSQVEAWLAEREVG
jgi:prophage regulatory protein|tara:strand:- start:700 stop:894 length:195 start_codon:yes stop_codon:yes gene_type:complete